MLTKLNAYIDECGAYGFDFSKSGNSSMFIVAAILVKEENIAIVNNGLDKIRKENFHGGEIKSNHIGSNHKRRLKILSQIVNLPFGIVALIVDKRVVFSGHGIRKSKKTFYKFINQLLYDELKGPYTNLSVKSDEVGSNEFCVEFAKYVDKRWKQITLFDQNSFSIVNSRSENGVQLADLIAGTLSFVYEDSKKAKVPSDLNYLDILKAKISRIRFFPNDYDERIFEHREGDTDFNKEIANIANRKAKSFIDNNYLSKDPNTQRQVYILDYLRFRFLYNNYRKYIPTKELMRAMESNGFSVISEQVFRSQIIGKLRDAGVIISSSVKGYKLPSSESEIVDYYHHVNGVIIPMIHRVNICNELLRCSSLNNIDYLDKTEFKALKALLEAYRNINHNPIL